MLRIVHLQDFRCFRDATIRLGHLTALVGPNASGKTAVLDVLTNRIRPNDVRQQVARGHAKIRFEFDRSVKSVWLIENGGGSNLQGSHPAGQYLHLDVRRMREHNEVRHEERLAPDGSNLANMLATLPRRAQEALSQQFCSLIPVLQDVDVRPSSSGMHRIVFQDRWKPEVWYEPNEVSDGTILTLGLLVTQHQPRRTNLLAIEEPEHGLHPYLLEEVISVLRRLARGNTGDQPPQVVLSTQSPTLLEYLEPHEVRFLSRNPDDGSVVAEEAPTGTDDWRQAYKAHQESLGSIWLSGSIGGVPGT